MREIDVKVEFQWNGTDWVDETANLISVSGAQEITPPHEAYQSGKAIIQQAKIIMANKDLRYSSYNDLSPLYAYLSNANFGGYGIAARIQVKIESGGSWEPIFYGQIKRPDEQFSQNRVTFTIWDRSEFLREKRTSVILENKLEHEMLLTYLELTLGLVDGVDFISPPNVGGLNTIDFSSDTIAYSWLDDESVWDELVDLAQASGGRIYVDRRGLIHFEKGFHWILGSVVPVETFTLASISEFKPTYDDKSYYDEVVIEYAERVRGLVTEVIWEQTEPEVINPGETHTFIARYNYPALKITDPIPNDHYRLTTMNGGDVSGTYPLESTNPVLHAQQSEFTIENTGIFAIVLSKMKLHGAPLLGEPSEQVKIPVPGGGTFHRRLEIRGNPHIQSKVQAERIANFLAWWYGKPKMVFTLEGLPGVPTREINQRIAINVRTSDADVYYVQGMIHKVEWTINVTKHAVFAYSQKLTCIEDVFQNDPQYAIIGTDTGYYDSYRLFH